MQELIEIFRYPFMQRALAAGLLVALTAGLLGVFVVQRGLSFLGDGLAHSAFGGAALGLFLGLGQPLWVALPFTLAAAMGIAWVRERTRLSSDTSIGIFFAVSVALGVLFIGLSRRYSVDAWNLLFGSILAIGPADLWLTLAASAVSLVLLVRYWGALAYGTFDAELAQTDGVPVRALEYFLFALAAVVIVISVKVVGVILIAAYLVIPAAAARLVSRSLFRMSLFSVGMALLSTAAGLAASTLLDVPSGSTIILAQAALFALALVLGRN